MSDKIEKELEYQIKDLETELKKYKKLYEEMKLKNEELGN